MDAETKQEPDSKEQGHAQPVATEKDAPRKRRMNESDFQSISDKEGKSSQEYIIEERQSQQDQEQEQEQEQQDDADNDQPDQAPIERSLSRVEKWALEYVNLDFAVQERALEILKRTRQEHGLDSLTDLEANTPLRLHTRPFDWSLRRKTVALFFPCIAALWAGYAAGAYAFAGDDLKAAWGLSTTAYNVGITMFVLGFGIAPVALALLSEIYGRYWIFVSCGIAFFLGTMGCAVTESFAGMLVSRFITGSGASVFATLSAGVVSDLFPNDQRNTPMALYSLCLTAGTGVGPLVSGALIQTLSWRWIFDIQMILIAVTTLAIAFVFEETRANVLLTRNCALLNAHIEKLEDSGHVIMAHSDSDLFCQPRESVHHSSDDNEQQQGQRVRFHVASDPHSDSLPAMVWRSLCFPLQLLATEPIVFWFSAWVSFAWAILYMQFSSLPRVYKEVYGFSNTQVGYVYAAIVLGCVLGTAACIAQDKVLRALWPERTRKPEGRLYFACFGSVALPAGLFWFGWTARADIHWIVPTIAVGLFVTGIFVIYLAVFNFLADSYARFASSAQAAQSMCRNILAGIFPLFTNSMFDNLGYGGGESLLGGIGILLCLVPWVLCVYGPKIRSRSAFAQKLGGD